MTNQEDESNTNHKAALLVTLSVYARYQRGVLHTGCIHSDPHEYGFQKRSVDLNNLHFLLKLETNDLVTVYTFTEYAVQYSS